MEARPSPTRTTLSILGALALASGPGCHEGTSLPDDVITFNDNGAWCWYQDPRAIIDPGSGFLLVGSVAAAEGAGGKHRTGDVDLTSYDLGSGEIKRTVLSRLITDDHDAPSLLRRPDGRYLSLYSNHNHDKFTRFRISANPYDGTEWVPEDNFDWRTIDSDFNATYSNLFFLQSELLVYNFSRADNRSPNILTSADQGATWKHRGRLTGAKNLGYVNGYYKYASNGIDRIDFVGTEHHPRDYNTSIYHGYLKDGKLYRSDDTLVDDDAFDDQPHGITEFTKVFAASTEVDGEPMTHAWPTDFQLDENGRPVVVFSARANDVPDNSNFNDHRFFHARLDGKEWSVHQLAKAGARLFTVEEDYTGLVALHPDHSDTLYASTPIDPRTGKATPRHEIYRGTTANQGATWSWRPITEDSQVDNIRPIVPHWDGEHTALLWLSGTMTLSQHYDMKVVGRLFDGY